MQYVSQVALKKAPTARVPFDKAKQNMPQILTYLRAVIAYCLKKSLQINPENWESYYHLGHVYYKLDRDPKVCIFLLSLSLIPTLPRFQTVQENGLQRNRIR
jgi:TPR repeat